MNMDYRVTGIIMKIRPNPCTGGGINDQGPYNPDIEKDTVIY